MGGGSGVGVGGRRRGGGGVESGREEMSRGDGKKGI